MRARAKVKININLQVYVISLLSVFLLYFCVTLFNPLISSNHKRSCQIIDVFQKKSFYLTWIVCFFSSFFSVPFLTEWFDDRTYCFWYFSIRWWGSRICSYSKHVALQWTIVYCYQIFGKVGSNHVVYIPGR